MTTLDTVLAFVIDHLGFLWKRGDGKTGYRFVNSHPEGAVLIESPKLRVLVTYHRGELSFELEPSVFKKKYGLPSSHAIHSDHLVKALNSQWSSGDSVTAALAAQTLQDNIDYLESLTAEEWKDLTRK
ncbi:MAG: hypothetical protein Q4C87_10790 [Actinomycetaceae bacterium]|nr:hypothetical protein [Actinomycetaceae bacterium]